MGRQDPTLSLADTLCIFFSKAHVEINAMLAHMCQHRINFNVLTGGGSPQRSCKLLVIARVEDMVLYDIVKP
jgi:hypothetical protein